MLSGNDDWFEFFLSKRILVSVYFEAECCCKVSKLD